MVVRVGLPGWSAWVVYMLVGTMQLVLIAMGISFKVAGETQPHEQRRPSVIAMHFDGWDASRRSVASSNVAPDERRPLMSMSPPPPPPLHSRDGNAAAASPAGH